MIIPSPIHATFKASDRNENAFTVDFSPHTIVYKVIFWLCQNSRENLWLSATSVAFCGEGHRFNLALQVGLRKNSFLTLLAMLT